ncbi:MAG: hypothetical protein WBE86_12260 [Candidatus Acidiferrales bacterium]
MLTELGAVQMRAKTKRLEHGFLCGALLCCGFFTAQAEAQTPSVAAYLGQIVGDDISVMGPSNAVMNGATPAIEFSSGGTIVVHSGKARVEFIGGGELDVCGPAKFTVLSSDQALTVALSFGRVHARFDASRPIAIYTPLVIATPMSIGDRSRDAAIGLTNTGTMCVLAARGAVHLQNQLSGETVIVPQPSEVFLQGTSFGTLPAAIGQCRCDFDEPSAKQATPLAPVAPASNAAIAPDMSAPTPAPQSPTQPAPLRSAPSSTSAAREGTVSQSQTPEPPPAAKNLSAQAAQSSSLPQAQAATMQPLLKINLPPIGYDAKSVTATAEPLSVATLMLAQEAVVEPEWIFHGMIVATHSAASPSGAASAQTPTNAPQPKKGFWAKLHDFFIGSH